MTGSDPLTTAELRGIAPFVALTAEQLEPFLASHRLVEIPAGQKLVIQGDWPEGVYLIRKGIAKVRRVTARGEAAVVALVGAGELFGEMAILLGQDQRTADVFSLTPMQLIKLRSGPFLQALDRCPVFTKAMAVLQSQRLRTLGDWYVLRGEDATTRILATLLELAVRGDQGHDPRSVIPDLRKREIAEIAGLARGTTSRILAVLRSRGILEVDTLGMRIVDLEPFRKRGLLRGAPG
jgi:CRP/FNR family cyclic AMP-dependent transcriptional regulator